MKKISQNRLTLDRETVRSLVGELARGQLRFVDGARLSAALCTVTGSSNPGCGCCSSGNPTNLSLVC